MKRIAGVADRPMGTGPGSVHFLDASIPRDVERWRELWARWPDPSVMAHPSYVRLFARPGDRVVCAAAETALGAILYPVIVRPIASEAWAAPDAAGCDLTTAYGYGGPFAWGVGDGDVRRFWSRFDAWALHQGVVTSFARLPLFEDEALPFHGRVIERGPNVVRPLAVSDEELWASYAKKVHKNVRRARGAGLSVEFDAAGDRLDEFLAIYEATMDRRSALQHYYFPRTFFESIVRELSGLYVFAHVLAEGRAVSSELILTSGTRAYFFLGGTLAEAFHQRPNDLLKHEAFIHCRDRGIREFVLGGGYRPDDGILRFKRSFAPGSARMFRVGVRIYDAPSCERLVECRREWERREGRIWEPASDFFPPYRS